MNYFIICATFHHARKVNFTPWLKMSTMIRENFETVFSQMAKNVLKLSTMVGENFEIYLCQMATNVLKLSKWEIIPITGIFMGFDVQIPDKRHILKMGKP